MDNEIKIHTYESMSFDNDFNPRDERDEPYNLIRAPKIPGDLQEAMDRMQVL
jgi:hypothetical protein